MEAALVLKFLRNFLGRRAIYSETNALILRDFSGERAHFGRMCVWVFSRGKRTDRTDQTDQTIVMMVKRQVAASTIFIEG